MTFAFRLFRIVFLLLPIVAVALFAGHEAQARKTGSARAEKAAENKVRKGVAAFLEVPETVVESVRRIPQGNLYEVVLTNGELFYTDKSAGFFILGNIIDAKTQKNITAERLDKLARIDFKSLPLEQAVKRVNGNGQRVIVTFEDPDCGYCKHLGKELQKVKDVTLYTFLYPIISEDSMARSRHIWCAENKAAAWINWIVDGKAPEARNCDSSAVERNMELGGKLRVTGTPVLFFADGSRIGGYREAADLEQKLSEISAEDAK
ncbi:MAG: DsbC family protein [Azoarcus sp.]|jgi:thiol:disulfide interchange protein DsbC|nr:DsbC family protein [Azoarcus sp.]